MKKTVAEYATEKGISKQAVRNRIHAGLLIAHLENIEGNRVQFIITGERSQRGQQLISGEFIPECNVRHFPKWMMVRPENKKTEGIPKTSVKFLKK